MFFDTQAEDIIKKIIAKQNVMVSSLPGMGLNTYIKEVGAELAKDRRNLFINVYRHDAYRVTPEDIEKLLLEKVIIENNLDTLTSTERLFSHLNKYNCRLVIVLHKIQDFDRLPIWIKYINSIQRNMFAEIVVLASADYGFLNSFDFLDFDFHLKVYIYKGFIENYNIFVNKIISQYDLKNITPEHIENLYPLTLGHGGTTKEILMNISDTNSFASVDSYIANPLVAKRIAQVFSSLEKADKSFTMDDTELLTKTGLCVDGKVAKLFSEFYTKRELPDTNIYKQLTKIEAAIYRILSSNIDKYTSLDDLAFNLGGSAFTDVSDWGLYKHINNINKKLIKMNLQIKNKRGQGYKLVK